MEEFDKIKKTSEIVTIIYKNGEKMSHNTVMKEKKGEHPFGDAGQLILFFLFMVVWISDSFFLRKTTFLAADIPLYIRLPLFVLLLITAFLLLRSSHFVIEGEKRPDYVVNTGAFKYIRHPIYMAMVLTYLGLTISTASLAAAAMFVVIFIFYNYIASYEERLLENKFGDRYKEYKHKTCKWIPRLPGKN
jgi:protein-S-isoprenylcysteine O-methyltransferase Ste14